jgi:uncharacterized membrane protein
VTLRTIFGLPAHPLLVHIPVVLVPLAGLAMLVVVAFARLRSVLGWSVVAVNLVSTIVAKLASDSGETLKHSVTRTAAVSAHVHQAGGMTLVAASFFVLSSGFMAWHTWRGRTADDPGPLGEIGSVAGRALDRCPAVIGVVLAVLCVVSGALATVKVIQIGHSGAKATWTGNPDYHPRP